MKTLGKLLAALILTLFAVFAAVIGVLGFGLARGARAAGKSLRSKS